MNGNKKKCHKVSNAKKCKRIFPASTIGKKHNEKTRNPIIESKMGLIIDLDDFFVLSSGSIIMQHNFRTVINLFEK